MTILDFVIMSVALVILCVIAYYSNKYRQQVRTAEDKVKAFSKKYELENKFDEFEKSGGIEKVKSLLKKSNRQ